MADDGGTKRVELVDDADRSRAGLPGYVGVGMLGGIVLGAGPLRDAVQGNGSFEEAMLRFVACLLVCLVSASLLGRLLDNAPPGAAADPTDGPGRSGPDDGGERAAAGDSGAETAAERISSSNRSAAGGA